MSFFKYTARVYDSRNFILDFVLTSNYQFQRKKKEALVSSGATNPLLATWLIYSQLCWFYKFVRRVNHLQIQWMFVVNLRMSYTLLGVYLLIQRGHHRMEIASPWLVRSFRYIAIRQHGMMDLLIVATTFKILVGQATTPDLVPISTMFTITT